MRSKNYFLKQKQLKALAEKLHRMYMDQGTWSQTQIQKLIRKIRILVHELSGVISYPELKKILGAAALLIGISFPTRSTAQSFAPPVANPFGLSETNYFAIPAFADLDGDGDLDLLAAEYFGILKYFENTGTAVNPQFAAPLSNPFGLSANLTLALPEFADLDGDGDMDLLVGEYLGSFKYFENAGSASAPKFAAPVLNPFGLVSTYNIAVPALADLDGDGDLDLLVGEVYGVMQYFENTGSGTAPAFAAPLENPFGLDSTYYFAFPEFADLDQDGDLDLLVGEYYGAMQYFQNTGTAQAPQFAAPVENPFGITPTNYYAFVSFADLDGDSDQDLFVGEYYGVMKFYENLDATKTEDLSQSFNLTLYPNPVSNWLNLDTEENILKVEIFDVLGENVLYVENDVNRISLESLMPGTYLVKVTADDNRFVIREIQKQ